ncbi:MAG: aldo/keto reductase [Cyanobacteria bacterium P01_A01_bin.123]
MEKRSFGKTDLTVAALGLGCSRLGGNLQGGNRKQAIATLQQALDAGINFYDTADSYGQGQSERLLGKAFKNKRDQVTFATKAGYGLSSMGALAAKVKPILKPLVRMLKPQGGSLAQAKGSLSRQDFSKDYLTQSVEGSLRRLQTDYLDIFMLHSPPTEIIKVGNAFETLAMLKQQGKLRYYGVSCETLEDALLCLEVSDISALQVEINLLDQRAVTELLPTAQQAGIAIVARQPFASGKLFQGSEDPDEQAGIERYRELAGQCDCSISHLALQFVHQLDGVSVVIAGANSVKHLTDNLNALAAAPLTTEQMGTLLATQSTAPTP